MKERKKIKETKETNLFPHDGKSDRKCDSFAPIQLETQYETTEKEIKI
jgi:hypothetical protein